MATTPASPPPSSTSPSTPAVSPSASPPPPPSSPASSPPQSSSSPPPDPPTTTSPPPQTSANPPGPATPSPPPQSPPPSTSSSPPPQLRTASPQPPPPTSNSTSPPPSQMSASPPLSPPPPTVSSSNPPQTSPPPPQSTPPPSLSTPPPRSSPPPPPKPAAQPPQSLPSPPSSTPPPSRSSPPPPSTPPTENSPPPRSPPPQNSTSPPPSAKPPKTSPPPPPPSQPPSNLPPPPLSAARPKTSPPPPASAAPPKTSPPPPASAAPPKTSPPPPSSSPPESAPPPPTTAAPTPENAPPPPSIASPNPPASPPTASLSNSTPKALPPSSVMRLAPPPSSLFPPSSVNGTDPSASENSEPTGNGGLGTGGVVGILVALSVVLLSLIGLGVWCLRKRRKAVSGLNGGYVMPSPLGSSPSPRSDSTFTKTQSTALLMGSGSSSDFVFTPSEPGGLGNSRSWFTYEELVKATNGFSSQNLLGEGGFGSVYYGCLPDGRELAVKQLNAGGGQGEREFKAEVEIISRIHHRHLVSLVGYCITENQRLLIYDYVPNNTLHFHLHGEGRPVMDWPTRVKIAAGAARGIAYLHEDCHPRIIHRDIKSSNILLDNNFEAKVSDFGLAKLALDANTHITTRVMGTFGYVAPEYASSGKLTEKSDVFSYGVVLLELITGRKPVDPSQPMGDESLVEWARPLLSQALDSEEYEGLVDPRLGKNYVESELFQMIEAAAACVRHSAAKRPRMGQVVRAFDNLAAADLTNGMRVGESEVFNSAQQSAQIRLFQRMAFGSQNYSTDFFSQGSSDSQR